ncbi:hypothetical protein ACVQD8_000067 [Klebsiella michiganensis]
MTDITELTGAPKHANQHRISRIIVESPNDELRQMTVEVEQYTDQLIEALEKAQQRITQLESRTVKLPRPGFVTISGERTAVYLKGDVDAAMLAAGIEETE